MDQYGSTSSGLSERRTGIDRRRVDPPTYFGPERRKIIERRGTPTHQVGGRRPNRLSPRARLINRVIQTLMGKQGLRGAAADASQRPQWSRGTMQLTDRTHERARIDSPVMVQEGGSQAVFPGTLLNFSDSGMYIESNTAPRLQAGIIIHMQNYAAAAASPEDLRKYYGQVRWYRKLTGLVVFVRYGIGVKLIDDIDDFVKLFSL
ncbi:MAG: PilZ domain-containing protein [Desulfobacterales bacterium]